jgi:hypothetical protein
MISIEPYLPVRTVPVLTNEDIDTGLARPELQVDGLWEPIKSVAFSKEYNLLPNERVREIGDRFASRQGYERVKEHFNGKQFTLVYMSDDIETDGDLGTIRGGVMFNNSYDKSISFRVQFMAIVKICTNGMTTNKFFPFYKFKHNNAIESNIAELDKQIDAFTSADGDNVDRFKEFVTSIEPIYDMGVTKNSLRELRKVLPPNRLTPNNFGKIMDTYLQRKDDSMWSLFNAGTEHYWHGRNDMNMNRQWVDAFLEIAKA